MAHFPPPSLFDNNDSNNNILSNNNNTSETEREELGTSGLTPAVVLSGPIIQISVVARLCRRGTPERARADLWQLLMGFLPPERDRWQPLRAAKAKEYREILSIVCVLDSRGDVVVGERSYRAVDVDIPRTMPSMHFFNTPQESDTKNGVPTTFSPTQQSLRRIIHTLAGVNKGLGYVQGMNELVGHLLYAFAYGERDAVNEIIEAEVFFCFQTMLAYLGDDFCRSLDFDQDTGVTSTIRHFERLFQFLDPILWAHLETHQLKSEFYAFRWITLLFTQEFNVPDVLRVWDFLFSFTEELRGVALYIAIAMLNYQRDELFRMNSLCEILPFLQSYPPCDVNDFLKIAMCWIDQYGFQLVKELKVATSEDILMLQRQYNVNNIVNNASWGNSLKGWMSTVKGFAKHVSGVS